MNAKLRYRSRTESNPLGKSPGNKVGEERGQALTFV